MKTIIINKNDENQTVFKFLKKVYKTTPLSVIYKWFRKKDIRLNGKRISDQKIILKENDELVIYDSNETIKRDEFKPVDFSSLRIAYEDDNILVADKHPNVEMHSEFNPSLDDIVKSYLNSKNEYNPESEQSFVVSHVHRLDKLTSGLVIYAKNKESLDILTKAIQNKDQIQKYYVLETESGFPDTLESKGYIYYDPEDQISKFDEQEFRNNKYQKISETNFTLLEDNGKTSLVEAQLLTGRKHQIRATLDFYNFPIINDFRYRGRKLNNERMIFLKAYKLIFRNMPGKLSYLDNFEILSNFDFN